MDQRGWNWPVGGGEEGGRKGGKRDQSPICDHLEQSRRQKLSAQCDATDALLLWISFHSSLLFHFYFSFLPVPSSPPKSIHKKANIMSIMPVDVWTWRTLHFANSRFHPLNLPSFCPFHWLFITWTAFVNIQLKAPPLDLDNIEEINID